MLIKVSDVTTKQLQPDKESGLLRELKDLPDTITQSIIEKNWKTLFRGVVVVDLAFMDEDLAVFDIDFLARIKGRRICARKEPGFM